MVAASLTGTTQPGPMIQHSTNRPRTSVSAIPTVLVGLEHRLKMILSGIPRLRRGFTEPVTKISFLARSQNLLDLVGAALNGLKKSRALVEIQRGGSDIDIGVCGRGSLRFIPLNPDRDEFFQLQPLAVHRRI